MSRSLFLIRHGQSTTNAANVFTGWSDPPLTAQGIVEAHLIAAALKTANIVPGALFTSGLQRAVHTAAIIRDDLCLAIEPKRSVTLNERDYGDLTGMSKSEIADRYGIVQATAWRRSWSTAPPNGESLRDTAARVLPFYIQSILPVVLRGVPTLVIAHGNSLRALMLTLEGLPTDTAPKVEIGTGSIRSYALAEDSRIVSSHWLLVNDGVN